MTTEIGFVSIVVKRFGSGMSVNGEVCTVT